MAPLVDGESEVLELELYYGTSTEAAARIVESGRLEAEDGLLGRGVYVARRDKAAWLAQDAHGNDGALVRCVASIRKAKYVTSWVEGGAHDWDGYDAVKMDAETTTNVEWCVEGSRLAVDGAYEDVKFLDTDDDNVVVNSPVDNEAATATATTTRLSALALRRLAAAQARQFNCPRHGLWFKKVKKPVARCRACVAEGVAPAEASFEAIPVEDERGRGVFTCATCGHTWATNTACRGIAQFCNAPDCGGAPDAATFTETIEKPLPAWRLRRGKSSQHARFPQLPTVDEGAPHRDDAKKKKNNNNNHPGGPTTTTTAAGGENPPLGEKDGGPSTTANSAKARHRCAGCATGACKRPPPVSAPHVSTGSTEPTLSVDTWSTRSGASSSTHRSTASSSNRRRRPPPSRAASTASSSRDTVLVSSGSSSFAEVGSTSSTASSASSSSFIVL